MFNPKTEPRLHACVEAKGIPAGDVSCDLGCRWESRPSTLQASRSEELSIMRVEGNHARPGRESR